MIKRTALLAAFVALAAVCRAQGPAGSVPPMPIFKAAAPVKIDGKLDDPCWKKALSIPVNVVYGKKGVLTEPAPMTTKYAWDEQFLYIAYEVRDEDIVAVTGDRQEGPPEAKRQTLEIWKTGVAVDVVEYFASFGDPNFFWEFHHNGLNQWNDVLCIVPAKDWPFMQSSLSGRWGIYFGQYESTRDDDERKLKMAQLRPDGKEEYTVWRLGKAVQLLPKADGKASTVNDASDKDAGYTAELRVPWLGLGAPKKRRTYTKVQNLRTKRDENVPVAWDMAGQEMQLLAVFQNSTLKNRYHISSAKLKGGFFHHNAALYPTYVLIEK